MAQPSEKLPFASSLVARTAATLPPGPLKASIEHVGSKEHELMMVVATMIELSQQKPGPQSEKSKAAAGEPAAKTDPPGR